MTFLEHLAHISDEKTLGIKKARYQAKKYTFEKRAPNVRDQSSLLPAIPYTFTPRT